MRQTHSQGLIVLFTIQAEDKKLIPASKVQGRQSLQCTSSLLVLKGFHKGELWENGCKYLICLVSKTNILSLLPDLFQVRPMSFIKVSNKSWNSSISLYHNILAFIPAFCPPSEIL